MMLTPVALTWPYRYLDHSQPWKYFDIAKWSYTWEQDEWGGWKDTLASVEHTLQTNQGDCEDYAFVIASYLTWQDKDCGIAVAGSGLSASHVVAFDDNRVYSSGTVTEESLQEWLAQTKYNWVFARQL